MCMGKLWRNVRYIDGGTIALLKDGEVLCYKRGQSGSIPEPYVICGVQAEPRLVIGIVVRGLDQSLYVIENQPPGALISALLTPFGRSGICFRLRMLATPGLERIQQPPATCPCHCGGLGHPISPRQKHWRCDECGQAWYYSPCFNCHGVIDSRELPSDRRCNRCNGWYFCPICGFCGCQYEVV